jgi:hypothetical protein
MSMSDVVISDLVRLRYMNTDIVCTYHPSLRRHSDDDATTQQLSYACCMVQMYRQRRVDTKGPKVVLDTVIHSDQIIVRAYLSKA